MLSGILTFRSICEITINPSLGNEGLQIILNLVSTHIMSLTGQ